MRANCNLYKMINSVTENHRSFSVARVNDHKLQLAVIQDTVFGWHSHPNSDELFVVLEGELTIEFVGEDRVHLRRGDIFVVEAGKMHRTIPTGLTANLCFEKCETETHFA